MSMRKAEILKKLDERWSENADGFNHSNQGIEERILWCELAIKNIATSLRNVILLLPDDKDVQNHER